MWTVILTSRFDTWLHAQEEKMQEKVLSNLANLATYGPKLPRPYADTVKSSKYNNMKELRIQYLGRPIRAFFAFDPSRQAIVLCAGEKSNRKRFYDSMIRLADEEFTLYLSLIEEEK